MGSGGGERKTGGQWLVVSGSWFVIVAPLAAEGRRSPLP